MRVIHPIIINRLCDHSIRLGGLREEIFFNMDSYDIQDKFSIAIATATPTGDFIL